MHMKILFGMPSKDSWGGPISSEPPFVRAVRESGVGAVETDYVYGDKAKPTPLTERIRRVIRTAFRLRRLLKDGEFDLVHLNTAFDRRTILRDAFSVVVMRPGRTKVFLKIHGSEAQDLTGSGRVMGFLMRVIAKRVDGFGIHTTEELDNFAALGFPAGKFHLVKNVIEPAKCPQDRVQKRPEDHFELLYVSRLVPGKCPIETIKAAKILKNRGFKFRLRIVGDGESYQDAVALAASSGLDDHVVFTGYLPEQEVSERICESDLLFFPTKFGEGFPNVFFKGVAAGLPIVASRFRAAMDLFPDETHCVFADPEPQGIAEAAERLIRDRELRQSMSAANVAFGKSLAAANVAEEYIEVYRKVLS